MQTVPERVRPEASCYIKFPRGKRFPKRARHKIIVETKFDGETLSTDPIDHVESPDFTTELAWELNKKSLHQHRLQRTPVKVQCYAVDVLTSVKEPVGYVILDLRSAQQQPVRPQWYPLLSSKYQRLKPELKLLLSLEDDSAGKGGNKGDPPHRTGATPKQHVAQGMGSPSPIKPLSLAQLEAMLNEEEGFYEVGPQQGHLQIFVLSVTIGLASNLAKLVPSKFQLQDPKLGGGFYFYYSLLGNDVTNEVFQDLLHPSFPAERASVRISSSLEVLKTYFNRHSGLEIHLCSADQSLGMAAVSLQSLLAQDQQTLDGTAVVEGLFTLAPPNQQQVPDDDSAPAVGVSVSLKVEQHEAVPAVASGTSPILAGGGGKKTVPKEPTSAKISQAAQPHAVQVASASPPQRLPRQRRPDPGTAHGEGVDGPGEEAGPSEVPPPAPAAGSTPNQVWQQNNQGVQNTGTPPKKQISPTRQIPQGSPARQSPQGSPAREPQRPKSISGPGPSRSPSLNTRPQVEPDSRHFCFSIDLRSIRDLDVTKTVNCFLRYTYPFFGSSAPVITSPPVAVQRHTEVLVPRSFCAFDFASTPQLLQETFTRIPLVVEVWHRDQMAGNILLGAGRISFARILASERSRITSGDITGYRQIYSERVQVTTMEGVPRKIGELHVVLGLEDLGPVNIQQLSAASNGLSSSVDSSSQASAIPLARPQRAEDRHQALPQQPLAPVADPRETAEYKAALELEMWKEQQEELYQKMIQERESANMKTLADEWKKRDKERELMMKRKLEEYGRLEDKLKQSIADLERREKQLTAGEAQVLHLREELEREHARNLAEVKEAARRLKEDCQHQVEMERSKVKDLEQQKQRLVEQLYAAEKRYQDKENDFLSYKEHQLTKPEVKLESEINLLRIEKVELERKLEASNKSKIHYKQQWGRALRDLGRMKQQEQAAAKARLKKQERELEHMRLRYLAAEEKEVVKSEKDELEEIKQELARLKEQEEQKLREAEKKRNSPPRNSPAHRGYDPVGQPHPRHLTPVNEDEENIDSRISKLIEERDTLLQTGAFKTEDRIIVELDKQIRDAIASKG